MENVFLIGRIVFAIMFLGSGMGHLMKTEDSAAYAESKGLSNSTLMVQISGVAFLAGGIGIALGIFTDLAFLLTGVLVMIIAVMLHPFWSMEGEEQAAEMPNFMKNLTIFGGCLMGFAFYAGLGFDDAKQLVGPIFEFDWR